MIRQGDIWWVERPDQKARPALVLTRNEALERLDWITVAPLTRTIRAIPTEVRIEAGEGVRVESVATFDNMASVRRSQLTRRLGELTPGRWHEVCAAVRAASRPAASSGRSIEASRIAVWSARPMP